MLILQGVKKKMAPLILRFSDYIFALIASIYYNELFIMNLSLKEDRMHLYTGW